jgi:hypothetical protein
MKIERYLTSWLLAPCAAIALGFFIAACEKRKNEDSDISSSGVDLSGFVAINELPAAFAGAESFSELTENKITKGDSKIEIIQAPSDGRNNNGGPGTGHIKSATPIYWPAFPRRQAVRRVTKVTTISGYVDVAAKAGFEVPFLVEADTQTGGKAAIDRTSTTHIMTYIIAKATNDPKDRIFIEPQPDNVYLNYWPGRDMVIMCALEMSYSAGLDLSAYRRFTGAGGVKVPLAGSVQFKIEAEGRAAMKDELGVSITQMSEMKRPFVGGSPFDNAKICEEEFYNQYKGELEAELELMWRGMSLEPKPGDACISDDFCENTKEAINRPAVYSYKTRMVCEIPKSTPSRCVLRSKEGGSCFTKNTSGMFEYPCDKGLKCVETKPAGIFNYAQAECRKPI